jgi:hypothetical protein
MSCSKRSNIDDPQHIHSFLNAILTPEPSALEASTNTNLSSEANAVKKTSPLGKFSHSSSVSLIDLPSKAFRSNMTLEQDQETSEIDSRSPSFKTSPARGILAPPPTPSTGVVNPNQAATSLRPIEEHDETGVLRIIADSSNLNLADSKHAPKNRPEGSITAPKSRDVSSSGLHDSVRSVSRQSGVKKENSRPKDPQDDLVAKFRREASYSKYTRKRLH